MASIDQDADALRGARAAPRRRSGARHRLHQRKTAGFHLERGRDRTIRRTIHRIQAAWRSPLLLFTAQRRSVWSRWAASTSRGVVHVRQQKTGTMLAIPVHLPPGGPRCDAERAPDLLTTAYGKPFTAAGSATGSGNATRRAAGALCRPWLAQDRLPQAAEPGARPTSLPLSADTRPCARSNATPRRTRVHGAPGHGSDHFTNGKWQRPLAEVATALKYKGGFAGGGRSGGLNPQPRFWRPVL